MFKVAKISPRSALLLTLVSVVALLAVSCAQPQASSNGLQGSLQIKGSDTMVNLGQAWAEEFMHEHGNVSIAVTGGGSGTGIAAMINGTTDIAETSRQMTEEEIAAAKKNNIDVKEHKVALDGLAVVVNPANPVTQLTMEQLRSIFIGETTNWKQVGGNDAKIVVLSRESNSGTHVYFKEHVLRRGKPDGNEEYAPDALLMPSSQAIADEVASNQNAIGYYGLGYVTPKQKALAVAPKEGAKAVAPSIDTVTSGEYPISRPLFMYTRSEPTGAVKAFLDFVLAPEGQQIVRDLDFVPLK